nr:spore germination protein [Piscibacillus salipiscarius]
MKPDQERKITKSIVQNRKFLKDLIGIGVSFDADVRTINVLGTEVDIYFVTGLNDKDHINIVMKELLELNDVEPRPKHLHELIENRLVNSQVEKIDVTYDAVTEILSGLIVILLMAMTKHLRLILGVIQGALLQSLTQKK